MMELYHNVLNLERLKSILENGFLYKHDKIYCVCLTRDFNYLSNRGIRMVFDIDKLKNNYKVKPFSYRGWCLLNKHNFIPKNDEMEERVFHNIDIMKCCLRIDIDSDKFKTIDLNHILINHTSSFKMKRK